MKLKSNIIFLLFLSGCSINLPFSSNKGIDVNINSPEIKQSGNPNNDSVTSSSSDDDSKLDSKDAAIGGSAQPSISPSPTPVKEINLDKGVLITSPQQSSGSTGNSGPIKDSDRGQGHPATPCDGVDPNSKQCLDYLQSQKPSPPPYSVNGPVDPNVRDGNIELIFKDEYKVRLNYDSEGHIPSTGPVFKSLTGENLDYINQIVDKYKLHFSYTPVLSEDNASKGEQGIEKECNCDTPNTLSVYEFSVKDMNIKEIVENFRLSPLVRQSNYRLVDKIVPD